jgi:hypothetical protein
MAHFLGDWSQQEKISEIKPPLTRRESACVEAKAKAKMKSLAADMISLCKDFSRANEGLCLDLQFLYCMCYLYL